MFFPASRPDGDALGRNVKQTGASGDYRSEYDAAGRRTRLTHPDAFYVTQEYLVTGEMTRIRENGSTVLATFDYDQLGRRERLTLGNGAVTTYQYDIAGHLWKLGHDIGGVDTTNDNLVTLTYNPASQIVGRVATNNAYAWTGHGDGSTSSTVDGLNRLTSQTTGQTVTGFTHDARGNRLNDGLRTYTYDSENKARGVATSPWHYDPLGRLSGAGNSPGTAPAIAYENYIDRLVAERTPGSSTVQRRHVFGPGTDEPLVWYEGLSRRFLSADERGSIVAVTADSGTLLAINRYDEYGKTETTSSAYMGRFGYTGQRYFSGFGLYHYKNRVYDPRTGRFMQTDPIGYGGGLNLYTYVKADPVNFIDPLGLDEEEEEVEIIINGRRPRRDEGGCDVGFVKIGTICASRAILSTVVFSRNSFSFTTVGVPDIGPGVNCVADGNVVTCALPVEKDMCPASGPVVFGGIFAEGYLTGGLGRGAGLYADVNTGEKGLYASKESGYGWGGSTGIQFGVATDMNSLRGSYDTIGAGIGAFGFNYTYKPGHFFSGYSLSLTFGPNAMPAPPGVEPGAFHWSSGNTTAIPFSGTTPEC